MIKRCLIKEFLFACRAFWELTKSFYLFYFEQDKRITVFGSSRFDNHHPYYLLAYEVGRQIALNKFTTMTGGGPGLMEAVNKGAFENGGNSIGCNIKLIHEQKPNDYMHKTITLKFFFTRKIALVKYSQAFIVLPGGIGTMDEFFEVYTLIQTGVLKKYPIVLIGKAFHRELLESIDDMIEKQTMNKEDRKYLYVTDSPEDALNYIKNYLFQQKIIKSI